MNPRSTGLHVLLVVDSLDHGGAEAHVVSLATALARLGHRPEIACSADGSLVTAARSAGVPVHILMGRIVKRRASISYGRRLRRLLASRGPFDIVHAHMYASLLAAGYATLWTGIPLVATEHSEARWRGPAARQLCRRALGRTAMVIAVSEGIRRRLLRDEHLRHDRVCVIMNAVAPAAGATTARSDASMAGHPLIGVIGRLHPDKGVRHFVEAAALLSDRLPDARFAVIGDGPERAELTALALNLGVADKLRFLGFRDDAAALVRALDALVVPSLSEGTPLVVLEAMQAGVPLVASAVGGIPDQVTDGREGLLVAPGDPRAIAHAVLRLFDTPGLATALAEAARRRAAEYDHATMVSRTEAVYLGVLRRAGQSTRTAHARVRGSHQEVGTKVERS